MGSKTPNDATNHRGMEMDWRTIELVSLSDDAPEVEAEPILAGLSAAPSDLHDAFLSDLTHLADAKEAHASVLSTAGEGVEAHFASINSLQTAEVAIANLGGFREGDSLILPLSGAIQDRVRLEMFSQDEQTTLRLNAEGEEGVNISRTFALPVGTELGRAGWRGNLLVLDMVRN